MTITMKQHRNDTRVKLAEMLTENTGRHFLDSGDHYGRNWQRNQEREFEQEPSGGLEARIYTNRDGESRVELLASLNVFQWLAERLEFNAYRQQCFEKWQARTGNDGQLPSIVEYVNGLPDAAGLYGDGPPMTINTYNGEDSLSQVIQYVYWEDCDGAHVILQIHGGCDVRGGYTDGVWFDVLGHSELAIFDNARLTLGCPRGCVTWDSDDGGYSFQDSGSQYPAPPIHLDDLEPTEERPEYRLNDPALPTSPDVEQHKRAGANTGQLWVDDNKQPHCPCCGEMLEIWAL